QLETREIEKKTRQKPYIRNTRMPGVMNIKFDSVKRKAKGKSEVVSERETTRLDG
ncbi:hypothetical protein CCACVL1_08316, partial [Corchorus capsularis]